MKYLIGITFVFIFFGCNVRIDNTKKIKFDCSNLTIQEKVILASSIENQLKIVSHSLETISDSSYNPSSRADSINEIIDNIKKDICQVIKL
jgi:hypothetical protein